MVDENRGIGYYLKFYLWTRWTFWPRVVIITVGALILWFGIIKPVYFYLTAVPAPTDHTQQIATLEAEKISLKAENENLRKEVVELIQKGDAKDEALKALDTELQKHGAKAKEGAEKQKEALEQYEKDLATIAVDIPAMDRCLRLCESRAALGYNCKPTAADYCNALVTR